MINDIAPNDMALTTPQTAASVTTDDPADRRLRRRILNRLDRSSFCTLATTSPAGHSHVAGVVYESVDRTLWVHTTRSSRKARSIAANPAVGVCVPFRRLPLGPPFTIHFQASAALVAMDDPRIGDLLAAGKLGSIAGHGALELPDGCFVAITPTGPIHSYGPGARLIDLIRDPLNNGAATVHLDRPGVTRRRTDR